MVSFDDVLSAAALIEGKAHRTPVATSRLLDEVCGAKVFLKCENFQRVGAFKFRGAYNAVSRLSDEARARGVITHSSGNHAQALALVCHLLGVKATIVMPEDAPAMKLAATRDYGAEVVLYDTGRIHAKQFRGGLPKSTATRWSHPMITRISSPGPALRRWSCSRRLATWTTCSCRVAARGS